MKISDLGINKHLEKIDGYLLNSAPKPIRDFLLKVAELDPEFKYENPGYYAEQQRKLEALHQPFSPKQHGDIYKLGFPALTERVVALKDKVIAESKGDVSLVNIVEDFNTLNLLAHRYQQLKDKNEETNFGFFSGDSSSATSRKLDEFFTESFSEIHSNLIKALPDSGKYDVTLLKNLFLENKQYPQKSKKWQQEFLSADKLLSIGERLIKDYKNPNNSEADKTIRFQNLVLLSERFSLFSQKNSLPERLLGSDNAILGFFAKDLKKLNDFWDKQLIPVFDLHFRTLTAQNASALKTVPEQQAPMIESLKSTNTQDSDILKKVKGLFNRVSDFIQDHTQLRATDKLQEAIKAFEEITEHLKGLLESKTANLKEV